MYLFCCQISGKNQSCKTNNIEFLNMYEFLCKDLNIPYWIYNLPENEV